MKSSNIGGQAVMEGIMMRHEDEYSIAVRTPGNEIKVKVEPLQKFHRVQAPARDPPLSGASSALSIRLWWA